jgi:hypothetical protein
MTVIFKTTKLESIGSPMYQAQAIDAEGKVLMTWTIACNESDDPNAIAAEGYAHAVAPPVILPQGAA